MSISESLLQLQNPQRRQPVPSIDGRICLKMQPQVITDLIDTDSLISANAGHLIAQQSQPSSAHDLSAPRHPMPQTTVSCPASNCLSNFISQWLTSLSIGPPSLSLSPSLIYLSLHLSSVSLLPLLSLESTELYRQITVASRASFATRDTSELYSSSSPCSCPSSLRLCPTRTFLRESIALAGFHCQK
jgi:hypothetical protein